MNNKTDGHRQLFLSFPNKFNGVNIFFVGFIAVYIKTSNC